MPVHGQTLAANYRPPASPSFIVVPLPRPEELGCALCSPCPTICIPAAGLAGATEVALWLLSIAYSANRKSSTPSQGGLAQDPRGGRWHPPLEHLVYLVTSRPSTASGKACRTSIDGRYGLNSFVPFLRTVRSSPRPSQPTAAT